MCADNDDERSLTRRLDRCRDSETEAEIISSVRRTSDLHAIQLGRHDSDSDSDSDGDGDSNMDSDSDGDNNSGNYDQSAWQQWSLLSLLP